MSYREHADSNFTHRGKNYLLNEVLKRAEKHPVEDIRIDKLKWVLQYDTPKADRKAAADLNTPIIVVWEPQYGKEAFTVVDGLHRLAKAIDEKRTIIRGYMLRGSELPTPMG